MRTKLTASLATLALSGAFLAGVAAPSNAATPTVAPAASSQTPGATLGQTVFNVTGKTADGSTLSGVFTVTKFVNQQGTLTAVGTLTGTLTSTTGAVTNLTNTATSAVVQQAAANGSCTILDLTLGPLHLDLLGLVVDTNTIHLTITAQQGPGNLLGNLLCGVANLLNGTGFAGGLANLLNQLLGL